MLTSRNNVKPNTLKIIETKNLAKTNTNLFINSKQTKIENIFDLN
jgi:hypothetical protein